MSTSTGIDVQLRFNARDTTPGQFRQLQKSFKDTEAQAQRSSQNIQRSTQNMARGMLDAFRAFGVQATLTGVALGQAFGGIEKTFLNIIKIGGNMEAQMNQTLGAFLDNLNSTEERQAAYNALLAEANRVGVQYALSNLEAAQALEVLGKAGLGVEASIAGLENVVQFAEANVLDLDTAARIVAVTLAQFSGQMITAEEVTGAFTGAALATVGEVDEFAQAFSHFGGTVAALGVPFNEAVAAFAALTQRGIPAARAATALRSVMVRMLDPTKTAATELDRLGVSLFATEEGGRVGQKAMQTIGEEIQNLRSEMGQGNFAEQITEVLRTLGNEAALAEDDVLGSAEAARQLTRELSQILASGELERIEQAEEIMNGFGLSLFAVEGQIKDPITLIQELDAALGALTTEERGRALNNIFTLKGLEGANALLETTNEEFERMREAVDNGTATLDELTAVIQRGVNYQFEVLKGTLETIATLLFQVIAGPLSDFTSALIAMAEALASADPWVLKIVVGFLAIGAAMGGIVANALIFVGMLNLVGGSLFITGTFIAGILTLLSFLVVAFIALRDRGKEIYDALEPIRLAMALIRAEFAEASPAMEQASNALERIKEAIGDALIQGIYAVARGFQLLVDALITVKQVLDGTWESSEGIHPFVKAVGELTQAFIGFIPTLKEWLDTTRTFFQDIYSAITGIDWAGYFNTAVGYGESFVGGIRNAFNGIVEFFNNEVIPAAQTVRDTFNNIRDFFLAPGFDSSELDRAMTIQALQEGSDVRSRVERWGDEISGALNEHVLVNVRAAVDRIEEQFDRLRDYFEGSRQIDTSQFDRATGIEELQNAPSRALEIKINIVDPTAEEIKTQIGEIISKLNELNDWALSKTFPIKKEDIVDDDADTGVAGFVDKIIGFEDPLGKFFKFLDDNKGTIFIVGGAIATLILTFSGFRKLGGAVAALGGFSSIFVALKDALPRVVGILRGSDPIFQSAAQRMAALGISSRAFAIAVSLLQYGLPIVIPLVAALLGIISPLQLIFAVLAGIVTLFVVAWAKDWGGIREKTANAVEGILFVLGVLGNMIRGALLLWLPFLKDQFNDLATAADGLIEALKELWDELVRLEEQTGIFSFAFSAFVILLATNISIVIGLLTGIVSALTAFVTGIILIITGLVKITTGAIQIFLGLKQIVGGVYDLITAVIAAIIALVTKEDIDWGRIGRAFEEIFEGMKGVLRGFLTFLEGILFIILGIVSGVLGTLVSFASGFIRGMAGALIGFFEEVVGIPADFDLVAAFLEPFHETKDEIGEVLGDILGEIEGLFDGVLDYLDTDALPKLGGVFDTLLEVFSTLGDIFGGFKGGGTIIGVFTGFIDDVITAADRLITEALPKAVDFVSGVAEEFGKLVSDALESAKTFVGDTITEAGRLTEEAFTSVSTFVTDSISELLSLSITGSKHVYNAVTWIIDEAERLITEGLQWFKDFVTDGLGALEGLATGVVPVIASFASTMYVEFQKLITSITTWGRQLIEGLISGIRSMLPDLGGVVGEVIGKLDAVRVWIDPGSPSKLWTQWGQWMMEGLSLGISQEQAELLKTITDVISSIVDTVDKYLDLSQRIATEDIVPIDVQQLEALAAEIVKIMNVIGAAVSSFGLSEDAAEANKRAQENVSGVLDIAETIVGLMMDLIELAKETLPDLGIIGQLKLAIERAVVELDLMFQAIGETALTNAAFAAQALTPVAEAFEAVISFFEKLATGFIVINFDAIGQLKLGIERAIQELDWMFRAFGPEWLKNAQEAAATITPVAEAFGSIIDFLEKLTFAYYDVDFASLGQLKLAIERAIQELDWMFRTFGPEWLANAREAADTAQPVADAFNSIFELLQNISLGFFDVDFGVFGQLKLAIERAITELSLMFDFLGPGTLIKAQKAAETAGPISEAFTNIAQMIKEVSLLGSTIDLDLDFLGDMKLYIERALYELFLAFDYLGPERIVKAERVLTAISGLGDAFGGLVEFIGRLNDLESLDIDPQAIDKLARLLEEGIARLGEAFDTVGAGLIAKAKTFAESASAIAEALTAGFEFLEKAAKGGVEALPPGLIDLLVNTLVDMVNKVTASLKHMNLIMLEPAQRAAETAASVAESLTKIFQLLAEVSQNPVIAIAPATLQLLVDTMVSAIQAVQQALSTSLVGIDEETLTLIESFANSVGAVIESLATTVEFLTTSVSNIAQAVQNIPQQSIIDSLALFMYDLVAAFEDYAAKFDEDMLRLTESFANTADSILGIFANISDALEGIKDFKRPTEKSLRAIALFLNDVVTKLYDYAKAFTEAQLEITDLMASAAGNIVDMMASVSEAASAAAKFVRPSERRMTALFKFIDWVIREMLAMSETFEEDDLEQVQKFAERVIKAFEAIEAAAKAGGGDTSPSGSGPGGGGGGTGIFTGIAESANEASSGLNNLANSAARTANTFGNSLEDAIGKVNTTVRRMVISTFQLAQNMRKVTNPTQARLGLAILTRYFGDLATTVQGIFDIRHHKKYTENFKDAFDHLYTKVKQILRFGISQELITMESNINKFILTGLDALHTLHFEGRKLLRNGLFAWEAVQLEYVEKAEKIWLSYFKKVQDLEEDDAQELLNSTKKKLDALAKTYELSFENLMNGVWKGVFDTGDAFFLSGKHLMEQLAEGIYASQGILISAVALTAEQIDKYLGFSLPEKGPLSHADEWMPHMMQLLAQGIQANKGLVEDELGNMAAGLSSNFAKQGFSNLPSLANGTFIGTANLNVTQNATGDLNYDAQELAQETLRVLEQELRNRGKR